MRKLLAAAVLALAACAGPTTVVRTVDTRPAIAFSGAPWGTVLYVDGVAVGDPREYDGHPNVLRVEPGTHDLELRQGDQVVFDQRVFVESELKTVVVH
ncbi:hypothetical protein [Anaeromyxobacter oryzisoli]|jgi:hypothetical protein|uniref:hypothetical protein n=1 Tax=Anaeromyxobacter oryzisoli TaxID=2925408 RepID=UPI001F5639CD|nr:hypothetical protein [Anaeromyxobacter sp. SG63]